MKFLIIARAEEVSHRRACRRFRVYNIFFGYLSKTLAEAHEIAGKFINFGSAIGPRPICNGPDGRLFTKQRDKYFFFRCNARAPR